LVALSKAHVSQIGTWRRNHLCGTINSADRRRDLQACAIEIRLPMAQILWDMSSAREHTDMSNENAARANLQGILDRLGPGATLSVDDRWLWTCFGDGGPGAADRFAKSNHCGFIPEGEGGTFIRAYFKQGGQIDGVNVRQD
jgi:hypothetical protein